MNYSTNIVPNDTPEVSGIETLVHDVVKNSDPVPNGEVFFLIHMGCELVGSRIFPIYKDMAMEMDRIVVSPVDYIGAYRGGVGVILALRAGERCFQAVYWFDPIGRYTLTLDDEFRMVFDVPDVYRHPALVRLVSLIDRSIPSREEIFREFGIK